MEKEDKSISKQEKTTPKSDTKSEKTSKPAKKVKGENIHKPEPFQPLKISTFEPPAQVESPSTDDSFFIDENPSKPKKPKQIREERRARTKDKIQEQRLTRDVAMISNSKFSQDKKRAYHEKQDLYNKQKERNDFVNKSNVRAEFGTRWFFKETEYSRVRNKGRNLDPTKKIEVLKWPDMRF